MFYLVTLTTAENTLFSNIYLNYSKLTIWIANRVVHDTYHAEDASEETFKRVFLNIKIFMQYNERQNKVYLIKVSDSKAKNILRRDRRKKAALYALGDDPDIKYIAGAAEDDALKRYDIEVIRDTICDLPSDYRSVIQLQYYNGMTLKRVSKVLDIPYSTTKFWAKRARAMLAYKLDKKGVGKREN